MSLSLKKEAFLEAIHAAPADDAVRMIYADYLQENHDPRGEFIRVQCWLASGKHADGHALTEDERKELLARENELLCQHGNEWAGGTLDTHSIHYFRRGFLEHERAFAIDPLLHSLAAKGVTNLFLSADDNSRFLHDFIAALASTRAAEPLTHIDLSRCRSRDENVMVYFCRARYPGLTPAYPNLTHLHIGNNQTGCSVGCLLASKNFPNLTHLMCDDLAAFQQKAQTLKYNHTNIGLPHLQTINGRPVAEILPSISPRVQRPSPGGRPGR